MIIRGLEKADLPVRVAWANDPAIFHSMGFVPPISLEKTISWWEGNQNNNSRFDAVFETDEGEYAAFGGLTGIDPIVRKAEFYVFANPKMHGRGIGTRATRMLCQYGFEVLQLHKIFLLTNESNVAARKLYEKVGFTLEGIHREEKLFNERYEGRYYYGMLASEFQKSDIHMTGFNGVLLNDYTFEGVRLKIVRDDIYPEIGGGIKVRKSVSYEQFLKDSKYNAVVTCGGIQSNHNRAIALMCARNGWKCHLCIQGTEERFYGEKGNALIDRLCGAECELIRPEDTAMAMDRAMATLAKEGYKPYYCHGGGHDLPGGTCFVEAVKDLASQIERPDYLFLASGTGSTQAGIVVGLDRVGWGDVKCIGISVARQYERGRQVIADFANMLAKHYGMAERYDDRILFNTDYLCGGYEQFTPEMKIYLKKAMKETGLMFDTTYSGKAFYGMMDYIKKHNLQEKKIVFWHTGGIMNIMK